MQKKYLIACFIAGGLLKIGFVSAQGKAPYSVMGKSVKVIVSEQKAGYKFKETETLKFADKSQPAETEVAVFIDPSKTFQTMIGIGGALTDAAAETYAKLPKDKQKEFLTAYYNKAKGIGYSFGRTNIQSCDFSSDSYSYVKYGDKELKTFDISHDKTYRIPFIKAAAAAAGGKLTMFVSPWSPPAFMKDNNDVLHGGKLKKEFDQSWANFYVKFIKAYEKEGVPIWGLSVQNEPMAKQTWESCMYTAEEERDFVKNFLGPTLQKQGLADKKLIVWDHNRDLLYQRASTILEDPAAAKYIWGIGFHWYETWTGAGQNFEATRRTHEAFPGKNLVFTEGCIEKFDFNKINDWSLGERYGLSMINDFNAGTVAWTDWNVLLDENGGPNHVGNFCFAPVHADLRNGSLIYTSSYYYIGHFSKYIHPGAKRISAVASRDKLLTTAYQNPDGSIAVVVMNKTDEKIDYSLWIKGKAAGTTALPHSIATLIVK
ncbi:glycosyl hydrolase [Mucilaginibacter rubeus]|uniref:Glycoside hydrolase family 30 protein n=1 Tax=Mucilaginibacter rubeus TaxID=2027860 RepID=A0AAE6MGB1_9SPHI|nr:MULTISPECIES: glycoside hydrolase family 30 protein [Mucilaginibacter]QEM02360.1 glycosyl hydrolase [Mucilaginibacter rubeus]QEM14985.1 glycosyl hydrolase [Mucilaginibacter gossypii]QTE42298.1 glycoside hydrolase family 30 protein [Mucilaginibacter rubeus]QTE48899.1 glycoside hydrolase family 30 protein [Mucilaginibacter rubeus]QTE53997.1 glycoside hydrolase family 30 protein [Mucilaginibacter rubeus]